MEIILKWMTAICLIVRYGVLLNGLLYINWRETVAYRTIVMVVRRGKSRTWDTTIFQCGEYLNFTWGTALSVIIHHDDHAGVEAIMFHEVGHKPDMAAIMRKYPLRLRAINVVLHMVMDPLNPPAWANWLTKQLTSDSTVALMVDHDMEVRADAYASARVGKDVMYMALVDHLPTLLPYGRRDRIISRICIGHCRI